jgi:peroxiredoxin
MEIVLLIARLILAIVFGIAGIAKAVDRDGTRKALIDFGAPERLATSLWWGLPLIEILVAVALLPLDSAWFGGIGALALLLIFTIGIGVNLARGQSPDCHCFGQLHSEPVSWTTLARNVALAAMAGFIVIQGKDDSGLSVLGWLADMNAGAIVNLVISAAAIVLLAVAVVYLRKVIERQTAMMEKIEAMKKLIDEDYAEPEPVEREDALPPVEGLPVGARAPKFSLSAVSGAQVTLESLLARGKSVLLLFVSPNCAPCKTLLPVVRVWERDYSQHLTIALISKGDLKETQSKMAKYGASHLLLQGESDVAEEYQARWTPAAVLISRDGKIASQVTAGDDAIRALVTHTVATVDLHPAGGAAAVESRPQVTVGNSLFKVGEPAPRFSLPDLQGVVVNMEELLGEDTLLVFWDPGCRFCQAMSDDIVRWEENPPKGAPRLVFISSGEARDVKAGSEKFKSRFLHDPEFDIAPLFGANSTPSAVLIDGGGKIASSLARGEKNILALAGVRKVTLPIAAKL